MESQIENLTPEHHIFVTQTTENIGKTILSHAIVRTLFVVSLLDTRMGVLYFYTECKLPPFLFLPVISRLIFHKIFDVKLMQQFNYSCKFLVTYEKYRQIECQQAMVIGLGAPTL